jgi:transketolase
MTLKNLDIKYKEMRKNFFVELLKKAKWARRETLLIHKISPATRIASSMSVVEIFVALFYGKILKYKNKNLKWKFRNRLIISKGHGAICLYPILADLGFFKKKELKNVCKNNSLLGGIPDPKIPGIETVNGSLGHGLGYACGVALALKEKKIKRNIFVILSDGELCEGSIWEGLMFAAKHSLHNIIVILDNNKTTMLDFTKNIIDIKNLNKILTNMGWFVKDVDGNNIKKIYQVLFSINGNPINKPKFINARTTKGMGVKYLEGQQLSHIMTLSEKQINDSYIDNL